MGLQTRLLALVRRAQYATARSKSKVSLVGLMIGVITISACSTHRFPVSDHSDGERFYNEDRTENVEKSLFDVIKWKFWGGDAKPWPETVDDNVVPNFPQRLKQGEGAVTFINHATDFIQFERLSVLTDPVFSERVSPVSWVGPKRHRKPGAALAELPKIDIVIISHNHFDHMDINSLVLIDKKDHPTFIVPLGNKKYLEKKGIKNVVELDWWQRYTSDDGSNITLVPMQHWSARGLFDRFEALWGGYVIESSGLKVMFAGDTGYNQQFKKIKEKFGAMDLSLLPIGAYEPRWFMKEQHLNPKEAVQAHLDLHSKLSVGMHFGTFQLTDEGIKEPEIALKKALIAKRINPKEFLAPKNGQTISFGNVEPVAN